MSLIDRARARAATPASPPAPPTSPGVQPSEQGPKPYKGLLIAAVILVVLAIIATIAIITLGNRRSDAATPTPPSGAATSAAAPSASPSLTERQQAAAAAEASFKNYVNAVAEASAAGGADKLPPDVAKWVTGPMRESTLAELKQVKDGGFKGEGAPDVFTRIDSMSPLTDKAPEAQLVACIDQTGVTVTKNGKPYAGKPQYIREQATMHREKGTWKAYQVTGEVWKGGTCDDAV